MLKYRQDIDGLRALAVLAVVIFHIDSSLMPGGFIGVDIFFVISGFLITGIINKSVESGSFSFREFYRRRIKRIIPVLTTVIIVTLVTAQFILLPEDLQSLASSAIASQLFVANIYFTYFLDTSYFADDAALQPLLHLWSLGVEEQFYLLWPLTLVLALRFLKKSVLIALVLLVAAVSFVGGEMLLESSPMFAYYMLPARAGELFVGALCFFATQNLPSPRFNKAVIESMSWLGFSLVLFSLVWLSEDKGFPGVNAIPVTLGTAFLIYSGSWKPTILSRVFSWRPIVAIGLISYSMYLWHWPLLAFVKYIYAEPTNTQKAISFVAIVLLSALSYHLIEKPFKADKRNFPTVLLRQFIAPTVLVVAMASLLIISKGFGLYSFSEKYRTELLLLEQQAQPAYKYRYVCQDFRLTAEELASKDCILGGQSEPKVLLWGDSNAAYFVGMLGEIANEFGFSFRNAIHSSCPPLTLDPRQFVADRLKQDCAISNRNVLSIMDNYDTVILAGAWNSYFRGSGDEFSAALQTSVKNLVNSGKSVILLGRVPAINSFDRKCTLKSLKLKYLDCSERMQVSKKRVQLVNSKIEAIAANSGARYFDINDVLCAGDICSAILEDQLVYHDPGHLSMDGSIFIGTLLRDSLEVRSVFSDIQPVVEPSEISILPWYEDQGSWMDSIADEQKELISGMEDFQNLSDWKGNKPNKLSKAGHLQFVDDSADSFQSAVFDFGQRFEPLSKNVNDKDYLLFEFNFQNRDLNFPMIRLTLERKPSIVVDFRIDGDSMKLHRRNGKGWMPSVLENEADLMVLKIAIPVSALSSNLKLAVFPSASDQSGGYAKKIQGKLTLESVDLYLVNRN